MRIMQRAHSRIVITIYDWKFPQQFAQQWKCFKLFLKWMYLFFKIFEEGLAISSFQVFKCPNWGWIALVCFSPSFLYQWI